jgi:nudix-type nucleoside diphosphatase (YffH/AdpP family)
MIRIIGEDMIDATYWTYKRIVYETDFGGEVRRDSREIFDRGNAATILLYDRTRGTIVLTRQFRLPAFLNGGEESLIETCAGVIENDDALDTILRETREETGFVIGKAKRILECYMSPGSVTEKIIFFIAPYQADDRKENGGGMAEEGEFVEMLEIPFTEALNMLGRGEIKDAKTIILLQYAQIERLFD